MIDKYKHLLKPNEGERVFCTRAWTQRTTTFASEATCVACLADAAMHYEKKAAVAAIALDDLRRELRDAIDGAGDIVVPVRELRQILDGKEGSPEEPLQGCGGSST
jgi:hypothetical protein